MRRALPHCLLGHLSAVPVGPGKDGSASAPTAPDGTFHVWGNLPALPPPLDDGMGFFRGALERKVICSRASSST